MSETSEQITFTLYYLYLIYYFIARMFTIQHNNIKSSHFYQTIKFLSQNIQNIVFHVIREIQKKTFLFPHLNDYTFDFLS